MGAPLHPVPNVVRVFLEGFVDGNDVFKWGNVLHFSYTGTPPDDGNCSTFADFTRLEWVNHMAPECPAPTTLTKVSVTDLSSDTGGTFVRLGSDPSTRGDDSIPANAAVLIAYATSLRYKGGDPRSYLYIGGNADLDGAAEWSTLFTAEAQDHWRAFCVAATSHVAG